MFRTDTTVCAKVSVLSAVVIKTDFLFSSIVLANPTNVNMELRDIARPDSHYCQLSALRILV